MKKITTKQAKEVLQGTIYADENGVDWAMIINCLSAYEGKCARDMESHGLDAGAKSLRENAHRLYEFLDNLGYYDDCECRK